jgi:NTE family protein
MDENSVTELKSPIHYNTLVLSGGSIKGCCTLGALQYFYDKQMLNKVSTYVGVSIGSIICYLLAIGYTPRELIVYTVTQMDFQFTFNIMAMTQGSGATSFYKIQEHIEKLTMNKLGTFLTLKALQERFGKTLICSTYNYTKGTVEYLSPETYPDLPCITALRMSANLPLIFDRFEYMGNFYLDGGIADNFPIDVVDFEGKKVLGIYMESKYENSDEWKILEYIYRLMFIPINQNTKYKVKNVSERCTILSLSSPNVKVFDMNQTPAAKLDMFSSGYHDTKNFMDNK